MIFAGMGAEKLLEEAVGLPFSILEKREVKHFCPCTRERVLDTIAALGEKEIEELEKKGEATVVECRFCRKEYTVSREELLKILKT